MAAKPAKSTTMVWSTRRPVSCSTVFWVHAGLPLAVSPIEKAELNGVFGTASGRPTAVGQQARRDGDEGVAGYGHPERVPAVGVDVQQDRGVGAADRAGPAGELAVGAGPRIGAQEKDVLAGEVGRRPVLALAAGVERRDVAVQPDPDRADRADHQHGRRHHDRQQEPHPARLPPAAPAAPLRIPPAAVLRAAAPPFAPPGPGHPGRRPARAGLLGHAGGPSVAPYGHPRTILLNDFRKKDVAVPGLVA